MSSDYIYNHILGDKERNLVSISLIKGKPFKYISNRYGLSEAFIRANLWEDIKNIKPIQFNSKNSSYYKNEMSYGNINLSYTMNDLSESELLTYLQYNNKHKFYYEF